MTRRVVITGMGIVSCLGNNVEEVTASLKTQKSGIQIDPSYQDRGFRSHQGNISLPESMLPPKSMPVLWVMLLYTVILPCSKPLPVLN